MQTVLVTGAAGGIGARLRQLLKGVYPNIRLSDVKRPAGLAADETFVEADLASMPAVENAVAGVDGRRLWIWVAPQDLVKLIRIGLEHADIRYEILYGASDNARGWWDKAAAFRLGYRPQGRAEEHAAAALAADAKLAPDPFGDWYQGGPLSSDERSDRVEPAPA